MNESNNEDLISSLYPPPPPYFKFFTEDNLKKYKEWKDSIIEDNENSDDSKNDNNNNKNDDKSSPQGVLKFLEPPKAPEGTHYRGYGNLWSFEDKLPNLKDSGWKQLYQANDESITSDIKISELHKLMDSLLLNFLELIGAVSIDPQQFHLKIEDLKLILININHILNTYRPHQSRESLIMLLKKHVESKKQEIKEIDNVTTDIKSKLKAFINDGSFTDQEMSEEMENEEKQMLQYSIKDEILNKILSENL